MRQRQRRKRGPLDVVVHVCSRLYADLGDARAAILPAGHIRKSGWICLQLVISHIISGAQRPYKGC